MANGSFWVDPEGVDRHARPYRDAADGFAGLSRELDELMARYPNAFGADDLGTEFSAPFMKGIASMHARIRAVNRRLDYVGEGLEITARDFRDTEDSASEVSATLHKGVEQRTLLAGTGPTGSDPSGSHPPGDSPAPLAKLSATEPAVEPGPLLPEGEIGPGHLTSSFFSPPATGTGEITVDGVAVGDGYRLLGANEIGDGLVRLTVDGFESVVPLGEGRTVLVDGVPVTVTGGQQLFLVRDAVGAPMPSPEESTYVEFSRDGTAMPYQP